LNNQKQSYSATTGQVIAMAGILQSAYLVDQIAKQGSTPAESMNPSINSLFQFDAQSPAAVYGGVHGIQLGLRLLRDILTEKNAAQYRSTIRYALGMLYLQKKLAAHPDMLSIIRSRLDHAVLKSTHFTNNINEISSSISAIYQDTVSTFKFRIQITGSMQQLQNPTNSNNIRALLLAGIRAAVLWRQTGGHRWHLFLSRKRLLNEAKRLLED
jgi:high frequency lysogenization protein